MAGGGEPEDDLPARGEAGRFVELRHPQRINTLYISGMGGEDAAGKIPAISRPKCSSRSTISAPF